MHELKVHLFVSLSFSELLLCNLGWMSCLPLREAAIRSEILDASFRFGDGHRLLFSEATKQDIGYVYEEFNVPSTSGECDSMHLFSLLHSIF
jgi:hypothetical protein